jgi:CubicO group peptidase (beta-lactamase class C family)
MGQFALVFDTWRPEGFKTEDISQHKVKAFSPSDALEMDRFLAQSTVALDVPGAAVAIVQDGKVVYRKAIGVKILGKKDPITPDTMFMIASMTKPLTTLMLSKLIEQGKLSWDTPINQALPEFALADKDITQKFLIKHAACACTGMPRRDFEFIFGSKVKTVDDTLQQLHTMLPTTGFGETFQYSNSLVAVGGFAGANVYGKGTDLFNKYENAMTDLVFAPLGMSSTRVKPYITDTAKLASPHARGFDGKMTLISQTIDNFVYDVHAPAGSIWSTVDDIAKYITIELRKGKDADGNVLFSEEQIEKRRSPGVSIGDAVHYGLGLFIENNKGITVIGHGGNLFGFTSDMFFMPNHNVGMVVLTNADNANEFRAYMKQKLLEVLLEAKPKTNQMIEFAAKRNKEAFAKHLERISIKPKETRWLADYVGRYENTDLGSLTIKKSANGYQLISPRWTSNIGSVKEQNGDKLLSLVSAPWSGSDEFALRVQEQPRQLILEDAQIKYVFDAVH